MKAAHNTLYENGMSAHPSSRYQGQATSPAKIIGMEESDDYDTNFDQYSGFGKNKLLNTLGNTRPLSTDHEEKENQIVNTGRNIDAVYDYNKEQIEKQLEIIHGKDKTKQGIMSKIPCLSPKKKGPRDELTQIHEQNTKLYDMVNLVVLKLDNFIKKTMSLKQNQVAIYRG